MLETAFTPLVVPRVGETPLDLRSEADRARTRGYAEGFSEGRRVALEEARAQQTRESERMRQLQSAYLQERGTALAALGAAHTAFEERVALLAELAAGRTEELAIELAAAILGVELSDPARSAAHALRRALDATPLGGWTRVTFSERDGATLRQDPDAATVLGGIEMAASAEVDPGGALVEVEDGAVNTRVAGALDRAVAALRGLDEQGAGVTA